MAHVFLAWLKISQWSFLCSFKSILVAKNFSHLLQLFFSIEFCSSKIALPECSVSDILASFNNFYFTLWIMNCFCVRSHTDFREKLVLDKPKFLYSSRCWGFSFRISTCLLFQTFPRIFSSILCLVLSALISCLRTLISSLNIPILAYFWLQ